MRNAIFAAIILFTTSVFFLVLVGSKKSMTENLKYFGLTPEECHLEQAINNDDARGVAQSITQGVNPNIKGLHGTTPLIMSVAKLKKRAASELLRLGADPNIADNGGDSAVTLAVMAYEKEPELLKMIMKSQGNPNALLPDKNPIIEYFLSARNFKGARFLAESGANINARTRAKRPLIISHGIRENWDVVWTLIELGAKYSYPKENFTWKEIFSNPDATPPDSPLWPLKVKVWKFLKGKKQIVPEKIEDLIGKKYKNYIDKKALP